MVLHPFKFGNAKQNINVADADVKDFEDEWVAIINEKIVAHNHDIQKVLNFMRKQFPNKKPLYAKISENAIAMY